MKRSHRVLLGVAAVLLGADVTVGPYLSVYYAVDNQATLKAVRADQESAQALQRSETALLSELNRVTGQPAQADQAAMIARLVHCLYNRIDYDTGHRPLDPTCAALANQG